MTVKSSFVLALSIGWFVFCAQWYCCWMGDGCINCHSSFSPYEPLAEATESTASLTDNINVNVTPIKPSSSVRYPISFHWSSFNPKFSEDYAVYKSAIIENHPADALLEITGYYFKSELIPDEYPDMGIARASAVMELFEDEMDTKDILIKSEISKEDKTTKTSEFPGVSFKWIHRK